MKKKPYKTKPKKKKKRKKEEEKTGIWYYKQNHET